MKGIIYGVIGAAIAYLVIHVYRTAGPEDVFLRMSVSILAGLYIGLMFITYALPIISDAVARLLYSDPGGEPEIEDPMHDGRALMAQGDYAGALKEFRKVTETDTENRMPWIEMAKIQLTQMEDPDGAVALLKEGLESHEWRVNDAAYFMFRMAEIHLKEREDKDSAVNILRQVIELFPETRHSANATHQLRELGAL
ncbi:hypothetical protein Rhal01_02939 [Rubritalea halochordaticola]|uniref:Tetratricopeptide repeat protein n=1 Tax=Rubritalea halochordaticola TaxID=714537 RepID=A0ABP9V250_9BACT